LLLVGRSDCGSVYRLIQAVAHGFVWQIIWKENAWYLIISLLLALAPFNRSLGFVRQIGRCERRAN
jgi:hypothetical protein